MLAVIQIIIPIIIIISLGFISARIFDIHQRTISTLMLYICVPALVFRGLFRATIDAGEMMIVALAFTLFLMVFVVLSWTVSKMLKLSGTQSSPFILSAVLGNIGHFGIPIALLTFGKTADAPAILIYVVSAIFVNTIGILIASKGGKDWLESFKSLLKMPTVYAAILGIILNLFAVTVPDIFYTPIDMLADSAIPMMILFLGAQLASSSISMRNIRLVFAGSFLRLIVAPLVAAVLVLFVLPLSYALAPIFIAMMAMPTAANATILAVEFDNDTDITAGITVFTTICSFITIPLVIYALQLIY